MGKDQRPITCHVTPALFQCDSCTPRPCSMHVCPACLCYWLSSCRKITGVLQNVLLQHVALPCGLSTCDAAAWRGLRLVWRCAGLLSSVTTLAMAADGLRSLGINQAGEGDIALLEAALDSGAFLELSAVLGSMDLPSSLGCRWRGSKGSQKRPSWGERGCLVGFPVPLITGLHTSSGGVAQDCSRFQKIELGLHLLNGVWSLD